MLITDSGWPSNTTTPKGLSGSSMRSSANSDTDRRAAAVQVVSGGTTKGSKITWLSVKEIPTYTGKQG